MYEAFFGLTERPFAAAPSAKHYFPAAAIEAARQTLARCIDRAEGVGLLIGPAGTGKDAVVPRAGRRISRPLLRGGSGERAAVHAPGFVAGDFVRIGAAVSRDGRRGFAAVAGRSSFAAQSGSRLGAEAAADRRRSPFAAAAVAGRTAAAVESGAHRGSRGCGWCWPAGRNSRSGWPARNWNRSISAWPPAAIWKRWTDRRRSITCGIKSARRADRRSACSRARRWRRCIKPPTAFRD